MVKIIIEMFKINVLGVEFLISVGHEIDMNLSLFHGHYANQPGIHDCLCVSSW